jgi:hypothetical protein
MSKAFKITVTTAIAIAALSLTAPAHAGSSEVGAGLAGFGIGAVVGSALAPQTVYVAPPPPVYYAPPPPVYYAPPPVYVGPIFYGRASHRHHHGHRR